VVLASTYLFFLLVDDAQVSRLDDDKVPINAADVQGKLGAVVSGDRDLRDLGHPAASGRAKVR